MVVSITLKANAALITRLILDVIYSPNIRTITFNLTPFPAITASGGASVPLYGVSKYISCYSCFCEWTKNSPHPPKKSIFLPNPLSVFANRSATANWSEYGGTLGDGICGKKAEYYWNSTFDSSAALCETPVPGQALRSGSFLAFHRACGKKCFRFVDGINEWLHSSMI